MSDIKSLLTRLILAGVRLFDAGVKPHVCHRHAVLSQRPRLVRADRRRGSKRLDGLQMFHQTVLTGHALRCQRQTHLHTTTSTTSATAHCTVRLRARHHSLHTLHSQTTTTALQVQVKVMSRRRLWKGAVGTTSVLEEWSEGNGVKPQGHVTPAILLT